MAIGYLLPCFLFRGRLLFCFGFAGLDVLEVVLVVRLGR
jgi:hypothetical protein